LSEHDQAPRDRELQDLLGQDEALLAVASEVGDALHDTEIDPAFMRGLRTRLVEERGRVIAETAERRGRRWRLRLPELRWPRPVIAGAGALAAAAIAAALVLTQVVPRPVQPSPVRVAATSTLAGLASVAPASAVVVRFDRPMNQDAVATALRVSPATATRTAWRGNDLVVTPLHGLVPNSPYVLTIDRSLARTAAGAPLAADLHVVFGTAAVAFPAGAAPAPTALQLHAVAPADDGSEALVTSDGSLLATSARQFGFAGLLHLQPGDLVERLAPPTGAICLSRTGRSLAYLTGSGAGTTIVMAASDTSNRQSVRVAVDDGSPLGWINDDQVSFVGGGRLQAVDRAGHVSLLSSQPVDAAHDSVDIAPGGRYVFVRSGSAPATPGQGTLLDLATGRSHPLPGIVGDPAFSADAGTVVWVDGSGPSPRLARSGSGGGPVLTVPLPLAAGDQVSDLGVGPDGSRLVYSVTHRSGDVELRLAALDSGATLAVAHVARAQSPNWSPAGNQVAVLGQSGSQPEIELVDVPARAADPADSAEALATAFANAQVDGDQDAMRALAAAGVDVSRLPAVSRASVVEVVPGTGGTVSVALRLLLDATAGHPAAREVAETLDLRPDQQLGRLVVRAASATPGADVSPGPHVVRIAPGVTPGTVTVTFDSDLDPRSVSGAVGLRSVGGAALPVRASYDANDRSVTLSSPSGPAGSLALTVGTSLRDVAGGHLAAPVQAPVVVSAP
jgi:Bacterial Ig-like domain